MPPNHHFYHRNTDPNAYLSNHARKRMDARGLSQAAVQAAFDYGREVHTRGAAIHVIGRKEVRRWQGQGVDISMFEGVHVVCSADGTVLTVYRNRDLRGLRPRRRRQGNRG